MRCNVAFIYLRGELVHCLRRLQHAVREAYEAGYLGQNILGTGFDLELVVHCGAGAYICGEETALLDSLEGYRGQPRLKPPFPATHGLYASPTVVNNVGTLASVPAIVLGGADWWKTMGPDRSPGTSIFSLSGRVVRPGQYEAPMGTTLRELLEMAGGIRAGHELKFWTPGGSSTPLFTAEHLDVPLDFDSVVKAGSMNGTSALQIFDDSDSVVYAVYKWTHLLRARVLRQVHAVPRGDVLDGPDPAAGSWPARAPPRTWTPCWTPATTSSAASFCALGDGATSPITSLAAVLPRRVRGLHLRPDPAPAAVSRARWSALT